MTDILARQRQLIGTTQEWAANDLVIGDGEIAIEREPLGSVLFKIGDGSTAYSSLPYYDGTGPNEPDPHFATEEEMFSDTGMGYGPGAGTVVNAGDPVFTGGGTFVVADEAAPDFDEETDGGVKLLRLSGFASVDELVASYGVATAPTTGAEFYVAGESLLEVPLSDERPGRDTLFGGKRVALNLGRHNIHVRSLVTSGELTDLNKAYFNTKQIWEAQKYLYAGGGGALIMDPDDLICFDGPLSAMTNVNIVGRNTTIRNIRVDGVAGKYLNNSVFALGSFATQDDDDYPWKGLWQVTAGQNYIRCKDNDTSWTAVGNQIMIVQANGLQTDTSGDPTAFGDGKGGVGSGGPYNQVQVRTVVRIAGSYIYTDLLNEFDIAAADGEIANLADAPTGAWATDVSFGTVDATREAALTETAPRFVAANFTWQDLTFEAKSGFLTGGRTGLYNFSLHNLVNIPSDEADALSYAVGGNLFQHGVVDGWKAAGHRRLLEIAGHSAHTHFRNLDLYSYKTPGADLTDQQTQIRLGGESSRNIRVTDSYLNAGVMDKTDQMVAVNGGVHCSLEDSYVEGYAVSAFVNMGRSDVGTTIRNVYFKGTGSVGMDLRGRDFLVEGCTLDVTASAKMVRVYHTQLEDVDGDDVRFDSQTGGVYRNNRHPNGGAIQTYGDLGGGDPAGHPYGPAADLTPVVVHGNTNLSFSNFGGMDASGNYEKQFSKLKSACLALEVTGSATSAVGGAGAEVDIHDPLPIPQGSIRPGRSLHVKVTGEKSGVTGSATLHIDLEHGAGTLAIATWTFASGVAADWGAQVEIVGLTGSQISFAATCSANNETTQYFNVAAPAGLDLDAEDVQLTFKGRVSNADSTISCRMVQATPSGRGLA